MPPLWKRHKDDSAVQAGSMPPLQDDRKRLQKKRQPGHQASWLPPRPVTPARQWLDGDGHTSGLPYQSQETRTPWMPRSEPEPFYQPGSFYKPEPVYQPRPFCQPEPFYQPGPFYQPRPFYQPELFYEPEPQPSPRQQHCDCVVCVDRFYRPEPFYEPEAQPSRGQQYRDCIVCGDTKAPVDFPSKSPTAACEHKPQTCSVCLASWMSGEVDTKGTDGIRCSECPQTLIYNDVQRAASPKTFAMYDRFTIRAALGRLPNFAWCLSLTCDAGQEDIPGANSMECYTCGYRQCLSHRIAWHEEETCEGYDYRISGQQARDEEQKRQYANQARRQREKQAEESKTTAMLNTVSKMCPNPTGCGWRIEKAGGCDHMTCRRCRWEFCWPCLASYKEIRRVGNTAHQRSCSYYA